jgi:hypothetical protein
MFSPAILSESFTDVIQHAQHLEAVGRIKITRIAYSSGYLVAVLKINWLVLGTADYDELSVIRRHPPLPYTKAQKDEALDYLVTHEVDVHEALHFINTGLGDYYRLGKFDRNCKNLRLNEMLQERLNQPSH